MLQTSFYMLIEYIAPDWPECRAYLERIAAAHSKQGRDDPSHDAAFHRGRGRADRAA
jgi:hypothetical protein